MEETSKKKNWVKANPYQVIWPQNIPPPPQELVSLLFEADLGITKWEPGEELIIPNQSVMKRSLFVSAAKTLILRSVLLNRPEIKRWVKDISLKCNEIPFLKNRKEWIRLRDEASEAMVHIPTIFHIIDNKGKNKDISVILRHLHNTTTYVEIKGKQHDTPETMKSRYNPYSIILFVGIDIFDPVLFYVANIKDLPVSQFTSWSRPNNVSSWKLSILTDRNQWMTQDQLHFDVFNESPHTKPLSVWDTIEKTLRRKDHGNQ